VFGNGMLLSRHIRLVAAFDHRHIMLDPNPDAETSFKERERMFKLPRSTWADYDAKLLSPGGGIHLRSAKSIAITAEVKKALAITQDALTPAELAHAILKAPVDLLYNGGIGTYVKATSETHAQVATARERRAARERPRAAPKVVAEGGNLGCTQPGRIEHAMAGGRIYTDAIDNSAGSTPPITRSTRRPAGLAINDGELTEKQRNVLLAEMTDDVASLVLRDNSFPRRCCR
jgi:glutamate dehydrogenase